MNTATAPHLKPVQSLEDLCKQAVAAKQALEIAQQNYAAIEAALIEQVGHKDEGSVSVTVADRFKVTTSGKLYRAVDGDALAEDWHALPAEVQAAFKWKPDVSITQLRALQSANPGLYGKAARYVTTKSGKPSLKVELKKP
jgi:hypothetical protein